ncbi:SprT family zinc-dependent metalloprotease [Zoogloea sp.]|uniref:M48 family metallopeptidase n=1 Tax=Zoogloea sp. TaxID=49181 RepID=UPI00260C5EBD|nr:SprT family zinc-dependent metalloprotease [Zoogloea sp.]MDD3353968.1 SprT family zinc-dependent metalloprotease [Zoogloea sp.]
MTVEHREILLDGRPVPYLLRRSVRRTLGLRIDQRGLIVGTPLGMGIREVEAFVHSHQAWVLEKLRQRDAHLPGRCFEPVEGACLPLLGEGWIVRLGRGNNQVVWHGTAPEPTLELALRSGADAREVLLRGLQKRGLEVFSHRVEAFCLRLGRPAPPVRLSSARTRWGSCSARSGIRLHWRLLHLPLSLIDYVVAHEVAHLVEMNHSPRFWSVVESLYPDHVAARRQLREAGASLPLI